MSTEHLTEIELDRVLAGDGLDPERAVHLAGCLSCRRRRDGFLAAVEAARLPDPGAESMRETRSRALDAWSAARPAPVWRWWAAAAAVLLLALVPLWTGERGGVAETEFNAGSVLAEVDELLGSDPLTTFASEDVVEVVVPVESVSWEGDA